jgi:hypothetical protein
VPVRSLEGCSILLFFAKPSLRTFVTFEVGVVELGGFPVYLPPGQVQIGDREPTEDVARNLSRWCHAIVARVYGHDLIQTLASHASVPVVARQRLAHRARRSPIRSIMEHGDARDLQLRRRRQQRVLADQPGRVPGHAAGGVAAGLRARSGAHCARSSAPRKRRADPLQADPRGGEGRGLRLHRHVGEHGTGEPGEARRSMFRPFQLNAEL